MAEKDNKETIDSFRKSFELSVDHVVPHWQLAARMYQLWRGKLPVQLDGTFSKVMLNLAFSACQDRIPRYMDGLFSQEDVVSLEAKDPTLELYVEQAEAWLRNILLDESRINIIADIIPTLQSATVLGTGYRMPCLKHVPGEKDKWEPVITSKDVDFFQIIPAPNGGMINPMDRWSEPAVEYFFYIDWWNPEQIRALSSYKGYQKAEVEKMLASKPEGDNDVDSTYRDISAVIGGITYSSKNDWRTKMLEADKTGKTGRRRIVQWFKRDEWIIVGEDKYLIYQGPAPMGDGILPLVKYSVVPDFSNWFGIGSIEMIEDIIMAILMNFNYRLDRLSQTMFPATWIRDDVIGNRPISDFHPRPYALHSFPRGVNIREAVFSDRMPEIQPQTFMEEDRIKAFMQEISGMPNYSKGMGGQGTLSNETATGIVTLVRQAEGRLSMETLQLELALAQECRLLLMLAEKHLTEGEMVRNPRSSNGFAWTMVTPDALTDGYTVKTHGTQHLTNQAQVFQKLMALYPLWNQNPMVNQYELNRQLGASAGIHNLDDILIPPEMMEQPEMSPGMGEVMPAAEGMQTLGGMASPQDISQQFRSVENRMTPEPGTGNMRPATEVF